MARPRGSKNKPKDGNGAANSEPADEIDFTEAGLEAAETLRGDIRDHVLREFKAMGKPWTQMNEDEQERVIHRANDIAGTVVNRAVQIAAHMGAPHLIAEVGQFTVKDGLKIGMNAAGTVDNITQLAEHHGAAVIVLVDPSKYRGERAKAEPDVVGDLAIPKAAAENEANLQKLQETLEANGPPIAHHEPTDTSNPPFAAPHDQARHV